MSLRWELIDLTRATARLLDTKNRRARTAPASVGPLDALRGHKPLGRAPGFVWQGMTAEILKQAFLKVCIRARIEGLRFHDLRYEAKSRLSEKGLNVMGVASISGY